MFLTISETELLHYGLLIFCISTVLLISSFICSFHVILSTNSNLTLYSTRVKSVVSFIAFDPRLFGPPYSRMYQRDGIEVRASALQSVDLGFISQIESYQKTLKMVFTASLLRT